jgi:hypothetical protein
MLLSGQTMLKLQSFAFVALMACVGTAGCVSEDETAPDDQLEDGVVDPHAELTPDEVASFAIDGDEPALTASDDLGRSRRRNVHCVTLSPFKTVGAASLACALRKEKAGAERSISAEIKGTAPRLEIECCWYHSGLSE